MSKYNFAVWGTQGGGAVRHVNGAYVFVEAPHSGTGLGIGDIMPDEWGLGGAMNDLAQRDDEFLRDPPFRLSAQEVRELEEGIAYGGNHNFHPELDETCITPADPPVKYSPGDCVMNFNDEA